jgi:hypothetical protein
MTFLCMYVLYPELVHLLHFSPFYLNSCLTVISAGLKNLYAFLYRKYINNIYLLYPLLPVSVPLLVWPVFILVLHSLGVCLLFSGIFVLVLYMHCV